jgi:hypothetical protein
MSAAAVRSTASMRASGVGAASSMRTATVRTAPLGENCRSKRGEVKTRRTNQEGSENGLRGGWVHDRLPLHPLRAEARRVCPELLLASI